MQTTNATTPNEFRDFEFEITEIDYDDFGY